jgi:hypothetical protein
MIPTPYSNWFAKNTRKLHEVTEHSMFRVVALVAILAVIALLAYVTQPNSNPTKANTAHTSNTSNTGSTQQSDRSSASTSQSSTSNSTSTSGSSTSHSSSSTTSGSSNSSTQGPCNSVLTADQAASALGGNPSAGSSNGISSQTANVTTITCSYTSGVDSVSIIANNATTPTGQHDNDDQFGSSRPSGVTAVPGYGQVAYWQASTGLNILQDNNWYVVSLYNNGTLSEQGSMQLAQTAKL